MATISIKKNFAYNMLYQMLSIIVPLITSPYLARVLGADNIGIYSWTYSIVYYFMIFSTLGINNYGNRTIASSKAKQNDLSKVFSSIYICQFIMSLVMIILYIIYVILITHKYRTIAFIQGINIFSCMLDITWLFYGLENFKVTVVRNTVVKLLSLICIFAFVKNSSDLWIYTIIVAGAAVLGQLTMWPFVFKCIKITIPNIKEIIPHIKPIFILFIPVLAISVFTNMDKYMIGKLSNMAQNGYYENADKIIGVPKAIITALGVVMLPRTANLIAEGKEEKSKKYIEITVLYTMIFSSALVFGMAGVSDYFSVVFWGEEFAECGTLIAFMSPAIIFSVLGNIVRTQYLIPRSKDREYTLSLIAGAISNLVINASLIPRFGAMGAVAGTVIAEFLMSFLQAFYVRKSIHLIKYIENAWAFVLFGFIMFLTLKMLHLFVEPNIIGLLLLIAIGGCEYLILSCLYLNFSKKQYISDMKKAILSTAICKKIFKF